MWYRNIFNGEVCKLLKREGVVATFQKLNSETTFKVHTDQIDNGTFERMTLDDIVQLEGM